MGFGTLLRLNELVLRVFGTFVCRACKVAQKINLFCIIVLILYIYPSTVTLVVRSMVNTHDVSGI